MKRITLIAGLVISFLASSCVNIEETPDNHLGEEICFTAFLKDVDTKTERQENTDVYWCPGDAISIFFNKGENGGDRFIAQNEAVSAIAEFKGNITGFAGGGESTGGEFWFWGIYPYSEDNSCDGSSITLVLPEQQTAKAGSFANGLFPTMAKAQGLELGFYNICGGFKFTVSRDDIKTVKFRGNADEDIAGKARIIWDENGHPAVTEHIEGQKEITVTAPAGGTFVPGEEYYIVFFPELLSEGFTMTFLTSDSKQGSFIYGQSRQLKRGIFINGKELDQRVTSWTDAENPSEEEPDEPAGGTESGLYLGLSTFERYLNYYPAHLISEESLESYYSIVDGLELTTLNGTVLYYSIDEDITTMQATTLPDDLFNVSIVTFTDGLDEGSLSYRRNEYKTKAEYLEALHTRLNNETVSGLPIKSYAIGLKGKDAESNLSEFRNNLEKIASVPANSNEQYVYEISDINELNSSFESIADQLSQNIRVQKVVVSIPFPEHGEKKRFILDNKSPQQSGLYIEGIVDLDNLQLVDVVYHGLSCTSGTTVPISADYGFDLEFTFEGIQTYSGDEIVNDDIQLWYIPASGSSWQLNTEFTPLQNSNVYTELKSAMVMLNLDLSKSLEGQLPTLKTGVKEFLSMLYESSVDPDIVKAVKLNKNELTLNVGYSETLQASLAPSTASASNIRWTSALPSVATVDQNGTVKGISEGTTIITVSSATDGKALATCTVHVKFNKVESISLNKTTLNMFVGKSETLIATISPADASETAVTWSSSDKEVATVSSSGIVTAHTFGNTTITVTSIDGNKTASCEVTVTEYIPSSEPIDLSLAVRCPEREGFPVQGYIPYDDLQYVNIDEYGVIGLTVLSNSGNFIIALEDASADGMHHQSEMFYRMPTYDQGVTISAKWYEINEALTQYGEALSGSYWTSGLRNTSYYYYIYGYGGSLSYDSVSSSKYIREVVPLEVIDENTFITKTKGIYLTYIDTSGRHFVETIDQVPGGCEIDGVAVSSSTGEGNVIIELHDVSSSTMTWSAAASVYGSENLPTKEQALLISARYTEINNILETCGDKLSGEYWTQTLKSGSNYYTFYGKGCLLYNESSSDKNYVRLVKGSF